MHEQVSQGGVELKQFVITKQLTKNPEDYPDAKSQAHVQVYNFINTVSCPHCWFLCRKSSMARFNLTRISPLDRFLYVVTAGQVQVALRMRSRGARDGTRAGNVVQYVICKDTSVQDHANAKAVGLALRAYHPDEIMENRALAVDTHYYLSHQLHPVVSRLCAPLDMTSDARLAECLGLDPSSFKRSAPAVDKLAAVRNLDAVAQITECFQLHCTV